MGFGEVKEGEETVGVHLWKRHFEKVMNSEGGQKTVEGWRMHTTHPPMLIPKPGLVSLPVSHVIHIRLNFISVS